MDRKNLKPNKLIIGLGILTSIIIGFFFFHLIEIPFGFQFHLVLYLFVGSVSFLMLSIAFLFFRKKRNGLKLIGIIPAFLSLSLIILTVIIRTDYRILYFKSISPKPTKAEWIEDLHHLKNQMIERHCDIHALISTAELEDTVRAIESRMPRLSNSDIVMELFKLSAIPNDAHTFPFIMMPCFDLHTFPIQVYEFEDGWTIVEAGRDYKDLIGCRIQKIGSQKMDIIYKSYPLLLAAESEYGYKLRFTYMCLMAEWLTYHKIIDDIREADFTLLKPDGKEMEISMPSIKFYPHFLWSSMFTIKNNAPPVFANPRDDYYRYELLQDSNTLYFQFNQCADQPGRPTLNAVVPQFEAFVHEHEFDRCVIDMRNNDGGSEIWIKLAQFIRDNEKINRRGRLFVLTSRRTFSSSVLFVNQLQMQTHAIVIGEPTGQGPIFYGGPYLIELPNSRLVFSVSTHQAVSGLPFKNRHPIVPDITVKYTSEDFISGRDPVLEKALSVDMPDQQEKQLPAGRFEKYTGRYLLNPVEAMDVTLKDASLHISYSDFIPGSLKRFQSKLAPSSDHSFTTKFPDMNIQFSQWDGSVPNKLVLTWQGETIKCWRAPQNHVLAMESLSKGEFEAGCAAIRKEKDVYLKHMPGLERMLNGLGYNLMRNQNLEAALQVFRLNTELYPESYNVYDSYGEALLNNGNKEEAIKNYKQSLILNPDSENGKRVLKELGVEIKSQSVD